MEEEAGPSDRDDTTAPDSDPDGDEASTHTPYGADLQYLTGLAKLSRDVNQTLNAPMAAIAKNVSEQLASALVPGDEFLKALAQSTSRLAPSPEALRAYANLPTGLLTGLAQAILVGQSPREGRTPRDFLLRHAKRVNDVDGLIKTFSSLEAKHRGHQLVWRGQQRVWAVQSSLRRALEKRGSASEDDLNQAEAEILRDAKTWGLASGSAIQTLANLQHQGAPTRLLDVSPDPYVAAWFATEPNPQHDEHDGLVVVWGRLPRMPKSAQPVDDDSPFDDSENVLPFWHAFEDDDARAEFGWGIGSRVWHWAPSAYNERMRAQRGGFIVEASPLFDETAANIVSSALHDSDAPVDWTAGEIARATSTLGVRDCCRTG